MRTSFKILIIVWVFIVFLWGVPYLLLHYSGSAILVQQLRQHTGKEVSLGGFFLRFPLHIELRDLEIKDVLSVREVTLSPDIISLFAGKVVFSNVRMVKPELYHSRRALGSPVKGQSIPEENSAEIVSQVQPATSAGVHLTFPQKQLIPVIFRHIGIQDGILYFTDYKVAAEGLKITLKDVSMGIDNFYSYPYSAITTFGVKANIPWEGENKEGRLFSEGWINFFKKDIQARMNIENIDGVYLEPYYNERVDFKRAHIEQATLRFKSLVQGLDNEVYVKSELELTDIARTPRQEDEFRDPAERLTDTLLVLFKSLDEEGRVILPLEYYTKLDRPEFGFGLFEAAFKDTVTEARLQKAVKPEKVLGYPGKLMEGLFKGVGDVSKAVIVGSVTVANELRKGVTASFQREEPVSLD